MGFKDRTNPGTLELSNRTIVVCRILFLSPYLKSHGFLFKILIKMCPLSTDGAILMWVFISREPLHGFCIVYVTSNLGVKSHRGQIRVPNKGRWAHINIKLLFFTLGCVELCKAKRPGVPLFRTCGAITDLNLYHNQLQHTQVCGSL